MNDTAEQLAATIAVLEAQRALLGDVVVNSALAPLRRELAALQAQAQPSVAAQRLKQVSVLFVDVVGSTAMGQQLGPEEIHAVMDGALARFTAIVMAHHGRVLQYTGDGMLAAFGADEAHEDDVEGAIRAGLGIIDEAVLLAPQVKRQHGVPDFNVRAGVHTGRVLLGGGVDAEGSIRGATVNVAARMEQSAPAGRLRISHDSWRHVRGLFDVAEQPPISVKGVQEPLRSYLVERVRPRAFRVANRGIEGVHTPMVGRASELAQLRETFASVVSTRGAAAVTVVGDAGLGKSRLLAELLQSPELQQAWLLLGRAHPRSELQPHGLWRDMLTRQFDITDGDAPEAARRKFVDGLAPLFAIDGGDRGSAAMPLLGHLIGLDFSANPQIEELLGDERQFMARAYDAAALCLHRLAELRPVLVILDDLHWADTGSLDLLRHVQRNNHDTPLLCLALSRPSFFEHHDGWAEAGLPQQRIDLKPLDKSFSHELANGLLQRLHEVPAALRALVTSGAEGNPFYMEELVKMLIDDGVIVTDAEGWRVLPDKLLDARVPPTLTGVLQARLDALGAHERSALQQAAIVGHVFSGEALAAIDAAAERALPALLRKQLVVRRDTQAAQAALGAGEFAFQHQLLHQVTYDGVLKAPKRHGHARVGAFWSARAEVATPQDVNPTRCRALAEAQHHRCQADVPDYVAWFEAQFSIYLGAYAAAALRPLSEQLISLIEREFGPEHAQTAKALTNLARAMLAQGDVEKAEPLLRRAIHIQEQSLATDHPDMARTLAVMGGYHQGRGDLRSAEPFFQRALDIRERVLGADHALTLGTLDNLAHVMLELGRLDAAEALSRRVLAARERSVGADHPDAAFALTALGEVLAKKGDFAGAEPLIRTALSVQQKTLAADHPDIGLSKWHLAETLRGLGRYHEALPLALQALEGWEATFGAAHEWTAWGLISLAEIRLALGDANEAAAHAERAAKILQQAFGADHATVASTLGLQARALDAMARLGEAHPLVAGA